MIPHSLSFVNRIHSMPKAFLVCGEGLGAAPYSLMEPIITPVTKYRCTKG